MLLIEIPKTEYYDEEKNEFMYVPETTLKLEHSLISISKWESHYCKPFLSREQKTVEESLYYIKCMTINPNIDPNVYRCITNEMMDRVNKYIEAPMTATTINDPASSKKNNEILTSELLYYYMIAGNVPVEFERWHLNRLITLIQIIGIKNDPKQKKMTKGSILRQNASLNAARRKAMHSRG
jgi:hypothetical protein